MTLSLVGLRDSAQLPMEAAKYPEDPRLIELVGELSMREKQLPSGGANTVSPPGPWERRRSITRSSVNSSWTGDTLTADTDPDQHLTVWTAAPGSPTHERLRILASWAADQNVSASASVN